MNEWKNESTNCAAIKTNQLTDLSINYQTNQPTKGPANEWVNELMNQPIAQS
jgi:hypothetical protein